jgi:hypothetical protein
VITKHLDETVWNTLLSILLYISNSILADKIHEFAKDLSANLSYTLFDIWIRSKTVEVQLWNELTTISRNWMQNVQLVDRWTSVVHGFTTKIISGVFEESKPLRISYNRGPEPVEFEFSDKLAVYNWY